MTKWGGLGGPIAGEAGDQGGFSLGFREQDGFKHFRRGL